MATKKFRCKVCGYIHEGDAAPEKCPQCQAPASEFEEITEGGAEKPAKKGLNTDGNTYTIIYSCIVVVIVAFLLAFVSSALKAPSEANERIDQQKQILASLNLKPEKAQVESQYKQVVVADPIVDTLGNVVSESGGFKVKRKDIGKPQLPVYVCQINGETKYVLPMVGKGLWGTIWGYLALNDDCETVYGAYFSHESETAGLGALIAEADFQSEFKGKN